MKFGKAVAICKNINSEEWTLEEKVNAIDVVMKAATINSVFKDDLCEVIRFLLSICTQPADQIPTNEDWFVTLTTEEKAKFLEMICYSAWGDKNSRFKDMADYTDWVEWLKEVHHEM